MRRAYVCGTFDTKAEELFFLADRLAACGIAVCTVDLSTRPHDAVTDVTAADVSRCGLVASVPNDRGSAIEAIMSAFERFVRTRDDVAGMIAAGGSGNTALVAPGMRALPIGVPKLIVSTIASGNTAPFLRESDIVMLPAVADVQGLNVISTRILGNAAHALAGMIAHYGEAVAATGSRRAVGLTMIGVTTACVQRACTLLKDEYDPVVFHAVGTGGRSMESLVDAGLLTGVVDVTTTEIADFMMDGVFPADDTRFEAIIRTRIPYVVSLGALDMVNFGAIDTVPDRYRMRRLYRHNPQITLMRTTAEENVRMAEWIAAKLNRMEGEVRLLIPEQGVSALDASGEPFHDSDADRALFDTLCAHVQPTSRRQVLLLPLTINDPAFATALADNFRAIAV